MAVQKKRPTTPAQRGMTSQDFDQITTKKPVKSLCWSVYLLIVYLKRYKQYFNNLPNKDRNNVVSNFMAKMGWDKYTLIINPLFKIVSYLYHKSN